MAGTLKHPEAVTAKKAYKAFLETLAVRVSAPGAGLHQLPTFAEWQHLKNLARAVLVALKPDRKSKTLAAELDQITTRYPDVTWRKLPDAIFTVLNTHAAPFDKVRAHYYDELEKASPADKASKDKDTGLLWWALEHAQWQPYAFDELKLDQWKMLGVLLKPFAKNISGLPVTPPGWNYSRSLQAEAQLGYAILNDLVLSGGHCRLQKGAQFSLQLKMLWTLNCPKIQRSIEKISHVSSGRYRAKSSHVAGNYAKELRPPDANDLKAEKTRKQGKVRTKEFRAKHPDKSVTYAAGSEHPS